MPLYRKLTFAEQEEKNQKFDSSLRAKKSQARTRELTTVTPPIYTPLYDYSKYFLKEPSVVVQRGKTDNPSKIMDQYIRECFNRYKTCRALYGVWDRLIGIRVPQPRQYYDQTVQPPLKSTMNDALRKSRYDLVEWYICVVQGGSLWKEYLKGILTKKETHEFINCPETDIYLEQAFVYGIAKANGASHGESLKLAKSRMAERLWQFSFFNSPPANDFSNNYYFWKTVVQFYCRFPPESISQINDLNDYFAFRLAESPNFALNGHTLAAMLNRMEDWHMDKKRAAKLGDVQWEGMGYDDYTYHQKTSDGLILDEWKITQIKTSKLLADEGNKMRHCVFSYKTGCQSKRISIWSLTKNGARKVTIELSQGGYIAQMRGYANRMPHSDEKAVIERWCDYNGFSKSRYY